MKGLLKIYSRYIGATWAIIGLLLLVNMGILLWVGLQRGLAEKDFYQTSLRKLEGSLFEEIDGSPVLTEAGRADLEKGGYVFLLVLNDEGDVVSAWNQPEGFESHYTAGEIAAFSRWYLHDYPVKVWRTEQGLLVAGSEKGSRWKHMMEFSMSFVNHIADYIQIFLAANLLIALLVVLFLGNRYYRSLQPLTEGIAALSANQRVHLAERGAAYELARQINRTSDVLEQQRLALEKRDTARTEWIAGVSHDIRTPLSMIMGYADELEQSSAPGSRERERAAVIKNQSLKIRQLIEDLNLTSKLEYHMQPLRICRFYPAAVIRELVAEIINEDPGEQYEIELSLDRQIEGLSVSGDRELILRAVRNLLNNSIRHNPEGCRILVLVRREKNGYMIQVQDDGRGIPQEIIERLPAENLLESMPTGIPTGIPIGIPAGIPAETDGKGQISHEKKPHIMGLRIVRQIALAHRGGFQINDGGHQVCLWFPVTAGAVNE